MGQYWVLVVSQIVVLAEAQYMLAHP